MGEELTPANFVEKIRSMDKRERGKIPQNKLIELILQTEKNLAIDELRASIKVINEMASTNKTLIESLNVKNGEYVRENARLRTEVDLLKLHAQECQQKRDEIARPPPQ